jgi:CheY-like chemotaxis protein
MTGASIILVEDEALIRMMLADMIEELGHRVVAEAGNIQVGQALAQAAIFDLAVLDINIAGYSIPYGQKIKSVKKVGQLSHPSVASPRVVR